MEEQFTTQEELEFVIKGRCFEAARKLDVAIDFGWRRASAL
jgi:hypothetical protein